MNPPDDPALAAEIEEVVRAVPGVAALYCPASVPSRVANVESRPSG